MIMSHHFFNWLILEAQAEIQKKIIHFLVQVKTLKFASEIYLPLLLTKLSRCGLFGYLKMVWVLLGSNSKIICSEINQNQNFFHTTVFLQTFFCFYFGMMIRSISIPIHLRPAPQQELYLFSNWNFFYICVLLVKFRYSEKVTKNLKNLPLCFDVTK